MNILYYWHQEESWISKLINNRELILEIINDRRNEMSRYINY